MYTKLFVGFTLLIYVSFFHCQFNNWEVVLYCKFNTLFLSHMFITNYFNILQMSSGRAHQFSTEGGGPLVEPYFGEFGKFYTAHYTT